MNVAGVIPILAPPQAVDAALHDPQVLQRMLPACEAVDHLGPGQFRGHLARKVGLLTLRVQPDIVLVPTADGKGFDLSVDAASRVAGSLSARLRLVIQREPLGTRMSWDGTITTTGLAQRLLAEREDQIEARVAGLFTTLKSVLEGG
jgi:carbon monoxide dehydrogenase subunit G